MCLSKLRIFLFISLVWNLMRSNRMMQLKPTPCAVCTGKCSHLDSPIALGRMELLEAWSQGLWHKQGLLCLGTLLILPSLCHCLAQITGRLSKTQSVDHPDTHATSLWKKISPWRKGFYFSLFSYKMELLFLQPRPLQEILSVNPFCSMTVLQNPAFLI